MMNRQHLILLFIYWSILTAGADEYLIANSPPTRHDDVFYPATVQSFTPTVDITIKGLQLSIQAMGREQMGSDVEITLCKISKTMLIEPVTNTNIRLSRTEIPADMPKWFNLRFKEPYTCSAGEQLGIVIRETSGGGANGWNHYGQTQDQYLDGQKYVLNRNDLKSLETMHPANRDISFRIVIEFGNEMLLPMFHYVSGDGKTIHMNIEGAKPSIRYTLESSSNLIDWVTIRVLDNTNDYIDISEDAPEDYGTRFFRLRTENESSDE